MKTLVMVVVVVVVQNGTKMKLVVKKEVGKVRDRFPG